jgi:hypothetical protein
MLSLLACALLSGAPQAQGFWPWFAQNEVRLADAARGKGAVETMQEISARLEKEEPGLIAEISVEPDPKKLHSLVISADGEVKFFPTVKKVAAAAPKLSRWRVVAFRPRQSDAMRTIQIDGKKFSLGDFFFREVGRHDGKIDIAVLVRGCDASANASLQRATYLLLDQMLGELDVETKLGEIALAPFPPKPGPEVQPLTSLTARVDSL